jgi:hypothetical protein
VRWKDLALMTDIAMAPVFAGWNVWSVWQVNDLPFSIMMFGVSRDRQLQIWVEDAVRLQAGGSDVADPIDLKGGQVQILPDSGSLTPALHKEQVAGPAMVVDGPATLRFVRFFNHGVDTSLPWPHDSSYLLDTVYQPVATNPVTSGPAPVTIGGTVGQGIIKPVEDALKEVPWWAYVVAGGIAIAVFSESVIGTVVKLKRKKRT